MNKHSARRTFVKRLISAIASAVPATFGARALAQGTGSVRGFDHVALPMQNTDTMLAFYQGLGFQIRETTSVVSVYVGDQMINFHRPRLWQSATFTLKAPAARPPCGDLCFVWDGPPASLKALLDRSGAPAVEGPVDRQGGRRKSGSSVYTRDPDGNLLEFIIYS